MVIVAAVGGGTCGPLAIGAVVRALGTASLPMSLAGTGAVAASMILSADWANRGRGAAGSTGCGT